MDLLKQQFKTMVEEFGEAEVMKEAEELKKGIAQRVPYSFINVLNPDVIARTIEQLDAGIQDLIEAGRHREAEYAEKSALMREMTQMETAKKLTEANALMRIENDGKDYVWRENPDGTRFKQYLTNDKMRDAYRRLASEKERTELAKLNGEIGAIDVNLARARDNWEKVKAVTDLVKSRAAVQSALLEFLK
jgi:hypothetical protein